MTLGATNMSNDTIGTAAAAGRLVQVAEQAIAQCEAQASRLGWNSSTQKQFVGSGFQVAGFDYEFQFEGAFTLRHNGAGRATIESTTWSLRGRRVTEKELLDWLANILI